MLRMKCRILIVEVVGSPRADGGCPSGGRQDRLLLAEVKHAEPVGDEVQTPEEEGLEWHEHGRNPHPNRWERGKLEPAMLKMVERWAIR